mgnify:CR=1 FL=1
MPKEYFKKKGQSNSFKMRSPFASHDGTKSSTTHYADGSPKDEREIEFSESKGTAGYGETEGQDEDKIFDNEGNQIGYWKGDAKYSMDGAPMKDSALKQIDQVNNMLGGGMSAVPPVDSTLMYKKKKK